MQIGAITGYIDVAQVALYVFWLFFFGLVFYLRKEDKREGYPLVTEREGVFLQGFPVMPAPKTFLLASGEKVFAPRVEPLQPAFSAQPVAAWPGAPMHPIGNAMLAGAGPAASALRADVPDLVLGTSEQRVVPLRVASTHDLDEESPDPPRSGGFRRGRRHRWHGVGFVDRPCRDPHPLSGGDLASRAIGACADAAGEGGCHGPRGCGIGSGVAVR